MKTYQVDLGDRSYPIHIGPCLSSPSLISDSISNTEIVIVTNETIAPLYLSQLNALLDIEGKRIGQVVLPDGEVYKNFETLNLIFDYLLEHSFSRKVALVALGGGVIGDMTGYAAASYQRGVDFYQVPTTLLSQVDSSVGGKTGINHALGKNMIGAFKQPKAVFIDTSTLSTLPRKEFSAGFSEVIKHGIIQDSAYFEFLESNLNDIFQLKPEVIATVVEGSCRVKSNVVSKDETEQGLRAILNLGHTFGHAIETTLGYGKWLHGEAVGVGLIMAADLSCRLGLLPAAEVERISELVRKSGLPTKTPPAMTPQDFLTAMYRDKKVDAGTLKLILINTIGDGFVTSDFSSEKLSETLSFFCSQ